MARRPLKYFMVDAFTDSAFKGNPAVVCLLEEEKETKWLQALASEFKAPVTCYLILINQTQIDSSLDPPKFLLRWFSPVFEADICGHATLAAAHALFTYGLVNSNIIEFSTRSGFLTAKRISEGKEIKVSEESVLIELDFPLIPCVEINSDDASSIFKALNVDSVVDIMISIKNTILVVLRSGKDVIEFQPNFDEIQKCPGNGIIITGISPPESEFDFYSRFFFPKFGVNEDFVCGSAHCALAPYWSKKLGKYDFVAYAASSRSGKLNVHLNEERQRVLLQGKAVTTMQGFIFV